jgi:SAM-dependent methyltransferase
MTSCSVCGNGDYVFHGVLEAKLIGQWQLSVEEVAYIDAQQGTRCTRCGSSLRVAALADAILSVLDHAGPLTDFCRSDAGAKLRVLDINGAISISDVLSVLPGYVRGDYPEVDMLDLPYGDESFDIVLHSDTLEHVPNPLRALEECRRVLVPGGRLCYTVPTIVGRMTRSREGLAKSYHGDPKADADDYLVHTEFGADMWCYPLRAGFAHVAINQRDFPAAIAITATRAGGADARRDLAARTANAEPELVGHVDRISEREIAGWALDLATGRTVQVEVLVDGENRMRGPASLWRPDLREIHGTTGFHGFHFSLDDIELSSGCHRVAVRFSLTGTTIPNGNQTITVN